MFFTAQTLWKEFLVCLLWISKLAAGEEMILKYWNNSKSGFYSLNGKTLSACSIVLNLNSYCVFCRFFFQLNKAQIIWDTLASNLSAFPIDFCWGMDAYLSCSVCPQILYQSSFFLCIIYIQSTDLWRINKLICLIHAFKAVLDILQ